MKFIDTLYHVTADGNIPFNGIKLDRRSEEDDKQYKFFEKVYNKHKISIDEQNEIDNTMSDYGASCERHGFEAGFKLGVRLVAEVFGNE